MKQRSNIPLRLPGVKSRLLVLPALVALAWMPSCATTAERDLPTLQQLRTEAAAAKALREELASYDPVFLGIVRYPDQVRDALLALAADPKAQKALAIMLRDGEESAVPALNEAGAPGRAAVQVLFSYPYVAQLALDHRALLDELAREHAVHGAEVRALMARLHAQLAAEDRAATAAWVERLRKRPQAVVELVRLSERFQTELGEAARKRQAYLETRDATERLNRRLAAANEKDRGRTVQTVYTYHDRWGYPYSRVYTTTIYTRSTTNPYAGYSGFPSAGIRTEAAGPVEVWGLPSYQLVHYILTYADYYPNVAALILDQYVLRSNPPEFADAVRSWIESHKGEFPTALLRPDADRAHRLAGFAEARRRAARQELVSTPGVPCPPGATESRDGLACPPPLDVERSTPEPAETAAPTVELVEPVADERVKRAANVHGGQWSAEVTGPTERSPAP